MVVYCPLASGSKGNAIYLASQEKKLLIDLGISTRTLEKRLAEIEVSLEEIDAILVSHEHSDHIKGIEVAASKFSIPIFANAETAKAVQRNFEKKLKFKIFATGETFEFGDIEIHPFSVQHDTLDPVAFTFKTMGVKIGHCTDLGFVTSLVKSHLKECDILYLEANHDTNMVHACSRPMVYKQRVLGRQGHLSNEACMELLKELIHPGLRRIYLAHLSSECNSPDLAFKLAREVTAEIPIHIAFQDAVSQPTAIRLKEV